MGVEMPSIVCSRFRSVLSFLNGFALIFLLAGCGSISAEAQADSGVPLPTARDIAAENIEEQAPARGDVIIDGRTIASVYESIGSFDPPQRAEKIAERIIALAEDTHVPAESVGLEVRDTWTEIVAGGKLIMAVTETDARMAGKPRKQLASEDAGNIRQAILLYRTEHNWNATIRHILYTLLVTALLLPIGFLLRKLHIVLRRWLDKALAARTIAVEKQTALQLSITYAITLILTLGRIVRWLFLIAVFEIYLTVVLSFYPASRPISKAITGWIFSALSTLGHSALDFLPNLFVIAFILVITSLVIRFIRMIFEEIGKGHLTISGFYPEWAEPTLKLVRAAVLVLVAIVIFPYLPGSKSPAFQGISIFVGVLLSLGSSSAIANAIAGVILTYMRSFSNGDWVKIGDTMGEVIEKSMLVTRIVTPKQEIITIPNATVMSGSVMNYTHQAKHAGVIFHTTVTIGYDAPWKTVHQLLLDAALSTEHVLTTPAPFVLQTALNDFFVSYELNAYTDTPREMQFIYSELHQNIQDKFNAAGVEICSPHFAALRDGNSITTPAQYIADGYAAPHFRIENVAKDKKQTIGTGR
jgi:small-conductance mechanosensitive channel